MVIRRDSVSSLADSVLLYVEGQLSKTNDPSVYLLTTEQMTEQAYPVPTPLPSPLPAKTDYTFEDWKRPDGWIEAPYVRPSGKARKVLGLDCEMVNCERERGTGVPADRLQHTVSD